MTVTVKVRVTPFWRLARTSKTKKVRRPRPERVRQFSHNTAYRRGAPPLLVWALSALLMIGFLSVSMFATISAGSGDEVPPYQRVAPDEDDPALPLVGTISGDCRVRLLRGGRLECLESMEYHPDQSGVVQIRPSLPGTNQ